MSDSLSATLLAHSDKVVQVENLSKKYGDNVAVNGISFNLTKGEVFAFLGPNGAGKTTTVEILECLRNPTGGRALVLGYDADKLIELVDLKDKRDEQFKKLSGGLKQRVGLAVSLVNDPDVVFLDEPTTGLDPRARRDVWGVIERLKGQGKTVFLTTHYMDEAEYLADIVSIIDHGQIIASGTPDQLIDIHGGKKTLIIRDAGQEGIGQLPPGLPKAELRNAGDIAIPLSNGELTNILVSLSQTPLHDKEIEVRRPTLDDVFLNLTGRRVSEEGN